MLWNRLVSEGALSMKSARSHASPAAPLDLMQKPVVRPDSPSRGELPVNFVEGSDTPLEYLASLDGSVSGWRCGW